MAFFLRITVALMAELKLLVGYLCITMSHIVPHCTGGTPL